MRHSCVVVLGSVFALAGCPGGDDAGGECDGILPGELVITEIFADHDAPSGSSGADEGKEWFELYNASSGTIDLEGLTITHSRPDGGSDHAHVIRGLTIAAGEYLVLGNVAPEFVEGILDYGFGAELGDFFNTDGGRLAIGCGTDVIDEALYDEVEAGKSTGFDGGATPDYTANDDLVNWCTPPEEAAYEFEQANFGTPGQANFDCEVVVAGQCNDGGTMRDTVPPMPGDLVLTEVMPSPTSPQDKKEYIEALVTRDIDLNGLGLARTGTTNPNIVSSEDCLEVTAGTYVVFAKSAESTDTASANYNGGLPRVDGLFTFSMVDAGDVQLLMGTTVIDSFTWANAPSTASYNLDPDFMDAASNDMERYWCTATIPWVAGPPAGDEGSPGTANEQCTVLPNPGECFDPPGSTTTRAIDPPALGELVITEIMHTPSSSQTKKEWVEVRANGDFDLNGLKLKRIGTTMSTNQFNSADCQPVTTGDYGLFAKSAINDPLNTMEYNGGLPAVDGVFTLSLVDPCADPSCGLQVTTSNDTLLDVVHWQDPDNLACTAVDVPMNCCTGLGTGTCTYPTRTALQLDPDITDPTANDTATNWCLATTLYNATDTGTPKAVNDVQCP